MEIKKLPLNNIKIKNPSFSVYMDNLNKNTPPREDFLQQHMNKIYPKPTKEWVDDSMVKKCQGCKCEFGWLNRKHHCRACGGVYCSYCCNIYTIIPKHLIDKPDEHKSIKVNITNLYHFWKHDDKSLVCGDCDKKITKLLKIEWIIKIGEFFKLKDLFKFLSINRDFHNAGIHWLSKFRNIQYLPPDSLYSKWEGNMLWSLRDNIISHNNWYCSLIKSVIGNYVENPNERLTELIKIINNANFKERKVHCWSLMCSRKCNFDFDIIDILDILQFVSKLDKGKEVFWTDSHIKNLFLILFSKITSENYKPEENIIPLLSITMRMLLDTDSEINDKYMIEILDKIIGSDYNFLIILALEFNHLYNNSNINNKGKKNFCTIVNDYIKLKLKPEQKSIILRTINTIISLNNNRKNLSKIILKENSEESPTNKNIDDSENISDKLPILYPFDTQYIITNIISVKELQSNSKPLLVKVYIQKNGNESSTKIKKRFIIKKDPYLRKENIVSSLISLLQTKLYSQSKKGRLDKFEQIPTYKILMISNDLGIIEYVDDSITLGQITQKGYTLKNYIYELNKNEKISTVNEKFIKSLAISSCLSYILGLGDRHLDNIMINKKGQIFHIDYGYLMENPITNIFGAPVIRVTSEMIDFLGGQNSKFYIEFKDYVIRVFDILRLYGNIILNYYYILGHENIINWEDFRKKITNRFLRGLSCKDVEISLIKEIEMSSNSYSAYFIDICHQYSNVIKKTLFK